MSTQVRHATEKWVNDTLEEALADFTPVDPGDGGGGGSASPVLTSPNGTRYRQVVDDDGIVTVVQTLEPGPPARLANPTLTEVSD